MKTAKRFFGVILVMAMCLSAVTSIADAAVQKGNRFFCDNFEFILQLVRKEPAKGAVFMNVDDNQFEIFNFASGAKGAFLDNVPQDYPVAVFTVYPQAIQETLELLEAADSIAYDGCRWFSTGVKPALAFNLRRTSNKNMIKFDIVNAEDEEEWQEMLGNYIVAETASKGEYTLDIRVIYRICFVKASPKCQIHRDLDWLDGMLSVEQYVIGTDNGFGEDFWRHHPEYAPWRWQEAYREVLATNYYHDLKSAIEERMEQARNR